jgi:hypothetical protein
MGPIDVFTLTDGGQTAADVARRVAGFLHPARSTLELAPYNVRLPDRAAHLARQAVFRRPSGMRADPKMQTAGPIRPSSLNPRSSSRRTSRRRCSSERSDATNPLSA